MKSLINDIQNVINSNGMNYQCSITDTDTLNDILFNYIDTQSDRDNLIKELIKSNQAVFNGVTFNYTNQLSIKLDSNYIINNVILINKDNDCYQITVEPIFNIFYKGDSLTVTHSDITIQQGNHNFKLPNDTLFSNNLFDILTQLNV